MISRSLNKIVVALLLITSITLGSCSKWLDVNPEANVNGKQMFSTPKGYQSVLNGVYVNASTDALYGGELMYRFMDALGQYYEISNSSHRYYALGKFDYSHKEVKPIIEKIWEEMYFCIANCNILLENIEKVKPEFFQEHYHYNMIKGEALALRAFFHLDLLRMFVPSPSVNPKAIAIPYVTTYSSNITPHMTTDVVLANIIRDLNQARELLKTGDPIYFDKGLFADPDMPYKFEQPYNGDYFASYRVYRLNYYAVSALLARVHAYRNDPAKQDMQLAADYAQEVMDSPIFSFVQESDLSGGTEDTRDAIFSNEQICCFAGISTVKNFEKYTSTGSSSMLLYVTPTIQADIFGGMIEDYRSKYLLVKNKNNQTVTLKYKINDKLPIIGLSEMYYIKSEFQSETSLADAVQTLDLLRRKRGVNTSISSLVITKEDLVKQLAKDAQKEYLAQGQTFYVFKRFNLPILVGNTPMTMKPENYVLPIPDIELEFGNRLQNLLQK